MSNEWMRSPSSTGFWRSSMRNRTATIRGKILLRQKERHSPNHWIYISIDEYDAAGLRADGWEVSYMPPNHPLNWPRLRKTPEKSTPYLEVMVRWPQFRGIKNFMTWLIPVLILGEERVQMTLENVQNTRFGNFIMLRTLERKAEYLARPGEY